ncbi:protein FAM83H isoform X1 [Hippoglossus hippoglossus]|uniref:protein FAM83H isoform X1 n=1 Tax=Hippoglossus hippoglossus TaxID=8267 RepID=UPI00148D2894|nr:protein FAM83H isoform X1 [Hippoglossus hippoglossus]
MARRSQCSSSGDNPLDPNYLPPHYREEYRLAIDSLVEEDLEGYYKFLQFADVVDFLSTPEIQYIQDSVQVPHQSNHPEQHFLETGADGSSDTYWPIHSDLDVPGLDLGWPQLHHFVGPTEITTLVSPPEPDMPSIKEQARRLIKNAQQVIAVVMDIFTDVDIFADILNAAMRNVAVYIILDEQNTHHFVNMVTNCRVDLQSIQFLRVRTVSGVTYQCRSGKTFKGQMMNRFLLTDCRAVLSGNYSFMWSFEKLHRSMAHLFLGKLVSTFDEEFRILFAQSQPLMLEKMLAPMEDFGSQKRQYLSERTALYREPRKFLPQDTGHLEERTRHSFDERMDVDWRLMPLKRQEAPQGPSGRFSPQQPRMEQPYDQGPSRITMLDNPAFKRHSYAEGVQGRFSHPFLQQQGVQEPENQGRQFHRGQQPYPAPIPGPEADYDKFWNQDFNSEDQYSEPVISQEIQPPDGFDPVLNYLSSTRNLDFDQSSDKLLPSADLPLSSPHHRRQSLGQPYASETSPTPSNPTDQKQFSRGPNTDRKDPSVKRGLRSWRISSYLSACDNPGDEGLPMATPQGPDPFEETSYPIQQTSTGVDLTFPKIPNVREFKVPAIPRASQMPSYIKTTMREKPKKGPNEPPAVAAETKTTPTSSESSSTAEVEKAEEVELKEPKPTPLLREESFRRKYNAATPRSSRLRSSLIFSSLDQQHAPQDTKTAQGQQDEESDKNEAEQTKLPFISQVLGKRRSAAREPFEWSRYIKSNTIDNSATETSKTEDGNSKADDKDPSKVQDSKDLSENSAVLEPPDAELPAQSPKSVLSTSSYRDMNDPDARFMFFKELAAERKAEKAAEAEKSKEKAQMNPTDLKNKTTVKKEEPGPKVAPEKMTNTSSSEGVSEKNVTADDAGKTVSAQECESSVSLSLEASDGTKKQDSLVENDPSTFQSCKEEQTGVSTDSKKKEPQISTPASSLLDSAETKSSLEDSKLSKPAVPESSLSNPPTSTNAAPADVSSPFTSKESSSLTPSSVEVSAAVDSKTQIPEPVQVSPAPLSKQPTGSEISSSHPSVQSSSSDPILSDSGAQIRPSPPTSISAPLSTPEQSLCSDVTQEDSSSTPKSSILSPKSDKLEELESVSSSPCETSQTVKETTAETTPSESVESVSLLTSSETPSEVDSANLESEISPDTCTTGVEPDTSSLTSTTETNSEESCAPTPPEKDVGKSETAAEKTEVLASPEDVKSDIASPSPSPLSPKSALPNVSDLKSSTSSPDQIKTITLNLLPDTPSETCSPVKPDITADASQSTSKASPQDALTQATPPSELNLRGSVTPTPVGTPSPSSPLSESVGAVLSPEAEKAETNISSGTLSLPKQVATDSNDTAETSSPTVKILTEPEPTPESVTLESQPSEPPEPAEDSKLDQQREISKDSGSLPDPGEKTPENVEAKNKVNNGITQESVRSEKKNEQLSQNICPENTSTEAVPPSQQSKQPKTSQSRYQSSTANVLACSNLRDDTKLLLEQISANSQSRNEATKEAPVTDDEKEDEADKNAKREKERGTLSRAQSKSTQEKEKLLERMQSMRKERKVYSRFEMAP